MQVDCSVHGVIGLGPESVMLEAMTEHNHARHRGGPVVEYKVIPAPYRCDLCGDIAEPPWWTHVTARPIHEVGDADGQWLVCDACNALVQVSDAEGLITRSIDSHNRQSTIRFTRTAVAKVINLFLAEATVDYHRGME